MRLGSRPDAELSPFARSRFLKLRPGWTAFAFNHRDFRLLERLRQDGEGVSEHNLISLVRAYAEPNLAEVRQLYSANASVTTALLSDLALGSGTEGSFEGEAAQSLFAIRHSCASQPVAADAIKNTLEQRFPKQSWVLSNLSYPLAYRFVAQPTAEALETFLGYLMPHSEQAVERAVLLQLLHEDACDRSTLAFRVYVTMMGHPYDACEAVLAEIERNLSRGLSPSEHARSFLRFAAKECGSRRAERLQRLLENGLVISERLDGALLADRLSIPSLSADVLARFLTGERTTPDDQDTALAILRRMQTAPYPKVDDFTRLTAVQSNWSFTEGGSVLMSLLRSLYMVERAGPQLECTSFLRLVSAIGCVTPYLAAGPSAVDCLRCLEGAGAVPAGTASAMEPALEAWLSAEEERPARLWIHTLQRDLRRLAEDGRVAEWLRTIRERAPYKPGYLTGIDWRTAEEIIEVNLLDDFMNEDGAYALLLMELEWSSDSARLDTCLEVILEPSGVEQVVKQLLTRYGNIALVFVRRFLTPESIMLNKMAKGRLEALEARVEALEACVRQTGNEHLSEDVYRSELNVLTSELLLTSLNSGMFEIPWATFRRDSLEGFDDLHKAYMSLKPALERRRELSELSASPASFPNGRKEDYRIKAVEVPLFQIIVGVIGDFFEHTAFGLEVILSGRFRHNNLKQEIWASMPEAPRMQIHDVPPGLQNGVIAHYRPALERTLETWADARLHTIRREKPDALFDLVPTQEEVNDLLARTRELDSLGDIVDVVIRWLHGKLREQIAHAGEVFVNEVSDQLESAFEIVRTKSDFGDVTDGELEKIHSAVCGATAHKVRELREWFGGIDSVTTGATDLVRLAQATAQRLRRVAEGKQFDLRVTSQSAKVVFSSAQLKIAFDMLREIFSNALIHGRKASARISIRRVGSRNGNGLYLFSNPTKADRTKEKRETFREGAFESIFDAIATEKGSGRPKIAASCSTLLDEEVEIESIFRPRYHHLLLELPEMELDEA